MHKTDDRIVIEEAETVEQTDGVERVSNVESHCIAQRISHAVSFLRGIQVSSD
jgi:hypothetical protein